MGGGGGSFQKALKAGTTNLLLVLLQVLELDREWLRNACIWCLFFLSFLFLMKGKYNILENGRNVNRQNRGI